MKYVTLKPQYALRGWSNLPCGLLDLKEHSNRNKVRRLTKWQLEALELACSPGIAMEDKLFPENMRRAVEWALEKEFLEECGPQTGLADYQKYHYSEARYTHTLLWSVTGNCNLKCRHCYISSGENQYGELDFEKCSEIMDQMLEANVNMVALTGGEPLVRKDFWNIVDALLERHISILQIFTNGMQIHEGFLEEFEKREIDPNYFLLSFDGVGCHDWLRGVKGSEKRVVEAIQLLKRRGYQVVVSTALHMGNKDSLLPTYALMKQLEVDVWKAAPILETGNWKNQKKQRLNIDAIYEKYLELLKSYRADEAPMELALGAFFKCERNQWKSWRTPVSEGCGTAGRCGDKLCEMVQTFPYLLPDGRVLPCISMSGSEIEQTAPNIFDKGQSLAKILGHSKMEYYVNQTYEDLFQNNRECAACEHRYRCTGCRANALCNGGFYEKDPLACRFFTGGYGRKIEEIMKGSKEK